MAQLADKMPLIFFSSPHLYRHDIRDQRGVSRLLEAIVDERSADCLELICDRFDVNPNERMFQIAYRARMVAEAPRSSRGAYGAGRDWL